MPKCYKVIIGFLLLCGGCNISDEAIISHSWKYKQGYHIGDWIEFKKGIYRLSNDTIYNGDTPKAIIIKKNNFMNNELEIVIMALGDANKGIYQSK